MSVLDNLGNPYILSPCEPTGLTLLYTSLECGLILYNGNKYLCYPLHLPSVITCTTRTKLFKIREII